MGEAEKISRKLLRRVVRFRSYLIGGALTACSVAVGLFVVNAAFLIWVRTPLQSRSFPRGVISTLSVPTRWLYPDTGRTGSSADIALIGDSYVEGDGDSFAVEGDYQYSLGHFLHSKTGKPFSIFAASGTYLPMSTSFYEAGLKGDLWPLFDSVPPHKQPSIIWLFFYEGNDLDDYFSEKRDGHPTVAESLPMRVKLSPMRYYLQRKWILRDAAGPSSPKALPNQVCSVSECRSLGRLQSASPSLSAKQVSEAIQFTANKIIDFAGSREADKICVFYIPSPATVYQLLETTSFDVATGKTVIVGRESNNIRSKKIREGLRRYLEASVQFVDLTEAIQRAAQSHILHGSVDSDHFNSLGYQSFAEAVLLEGKSCLPSVRHL